MSWSWSAVIEQVSFYYYFYYYNMYHNEVKSRAGWTCWFWTIGVNQQNVKLLNEGKLKLDEMFVVKLTMII